MKNYNPVFDNVIPFPPCITPSNFDAGFNFGRAITKQFSAPTTPTATVRLNYTRTNNLRTFVAGLIMALPTDILQHLVDIAYTEYNAREEVRISKEQVNGD